MSEAAAQNTGAPASTPVSPVSKTLTMTPKAITEVKRLRSQDPKTANSALRVQVVGGGCSGMSYKLGFEDKGPGATDKVFDMDGVQVLVDAKSFLFVAGIEIDFSDGLQGTGFTFNNPNAKRTCGCGTSFSA